VPPVRARAGFGRGAIAGREQRHRRRGGSSGAAVGAGVGLLGGSAVGAGYGYDAGYAVQRRYDYGYLQCMYAKGNKVPVSRSYAQPREQAAYPPPGSGYPPPPPPNAPPPGAVR
jgi:hypothetical protein